MGGACSTGKEVVESEMTAKKKTEWELATEARGRYYMYKGRDQNKALLAAAEAVDHYPRAIEWAQMEFVAVTTSEEITFLRNFIKTLQLEYGNMLIVVGRKEDGIAVLRNANSKQARSAVLPEINRAYSGPFTPRPPVSPFPPGGSAQNNNGPVAAVSSTALRHEPESPSSENHGEGGSTVSAPTP